MNYCLYNSKNKYLDKVNEILISLPLIKELDLKKLVDTLSLYEDKQINLLFKDVKDCLENHGPQVIQAIKVKYPNLNLVLVLPTYTDTEDDYELLQMIKFSKLPYFYRHLATNWETLHGLINLGVSEIYIAEALCFELDKVAEILHSRNIKVRTFPNIAQAAWKIENNLKAFYIRPEDVEIYESYIDTLEFFYCEKAEEETCYKIYAINKKWPGPLNEIIKELDSEINGSFIIPHFAEKRIRCGQKCLKGGSCQMCNRCEEMSTVLDKKD